MLYPDNIESKLGFDKVRSLLSGRCLSPMGQELVGDMAFMTNAEEVFSQARLCEQMRLLLADDLALPADGYLDVRDALRRIRVSGTFFEVDEVWSLLRFVVAVRLVSVFLRRLDAERFPALQAMAQDVFTFEDLERYLGRIVDPMGNIRDSASPQLSSIRQEVASAKGGISRTLNAILRSAKADGIVEPDVSPQLCDGRLVLPVLPANKRRIRGIVVGESATGRTVFVEPEAVVEANNRIRELMAEERREVVRILTLAADEVRPRTDELVFMSSFLAQVDFLRAKALVAIDMDAHLPQLCPDPYLEWYSAVHPLLAASLRAHGREVVPLTISLNDKDRILMISGPNAGGKSVCLKTVGLLQYMFQCGLLPPMHQNSHMGIFLDLMIDIGDEQSIEHDLSTYSSHLANMKAFARNCRWGSLILIDEFGSGTEPQIGGALAVALLSHFNGKRAMGVVTTHYNSLKNFASDTEGIVNGAMQYDRNLMAPLFKLEVGNPGSSFALDIARKTGLPEEVIAHAQQIVGSDYVNMDKYLQDVVRDKRYWENKRQNIRVKSKAIEDSEQKLSAELSGIQELRKQILAQAREEAKDIVGRANALIENTVRQIKEAQAEKEATKQVRQQVSSFRNSLNDDAPALPGSESDAIDRKIAKLRARDEARARRLAQGSGAAGTSAAPDAEPSAAPAAIAVGSLVRLKGHKLPATVHSICGNMAVIVMGGIKVNASLDSLEPTTKGQVRRDLAQDIKPGTVAAAIASQSARASNVTDQVRQKSLNFSHELDVRGMRADEALVAVQYFIDDAVMLSASQVRILHGTGTGALRQCIRQYLATVPSVLSYHDEHVQLGGAGITVVNLE